VDGAWEVVDEDRPPDPQFVAETLRRGELVGGRYV